MKWKKKVVQKPIISLHTCMIWNWECHKKIRELIKPYEEDTEST